jgi:hypothetical protein
MTAVKYIILLTFSFTFVPLHAYCQNKKAIPAQIEDIFGDLPINDPSSLSTLAAGENGQEKISKYILVNGFLNKSSCYAGEPVLLTYELLSALKSTSTVHRPPPFTGFQIIEMDTDNDFPKFRKKEGISYSLFTVKRSQLIPFQEGDLEIGPIAINNEVTYIKNQKQIRYTGWVTGKPVKLKVLPLPEANRPETFSGAVGNFRIETRLKADSFPAGENNTLEIVIRGAGNFHSLTPPAVYWPAGFKQFAISEKSRLNEKTFPVEGERIISVPFVAEQQGTYIIPPVEFSFFDPSRKQYVRTLSNQIRLLVTPSSKKPAPDVTNAQSAKKTTGNYLWLFLIVAVFAVTARILVLLKRRRVVARAKGEARERQEIVQKSEEKKNERLRSSIAQLETLEPTKNYIATFKQVLLNFLQDKLKTSAGLEEIAESITAKDPETGQILSALLQECNMWLYAPISPDNEIRKKLVEELHSVIEKTNRLYLE